LVLFPVAWSDAGQVLDLIKTVPDAALQTPRRCCYFRLAGLTYNFLQTEE